MNQHLHPIFQQALAPHIPKYDIHMMESFGGSFVKSLAKCYYAADSTNKQRLRAAFPEYFHEYEQMHQHSLAR